jgi:hypothetical protein
MTRAIWLLGFLAACGGADYCEESRKWAEECGATVSDEDVASCQEELEPCDGSDQKALVKATECLQDIGMFSLCGDDDQMTTPTSTEDLAALAIKALECNGHLADVSQECLAASGFSGGTDFTSMTGM